nr:biotin--[acetyl-CoA-carboxylase] ligase [candidate division Zixibacteria bacterium]
MKRSMQAAEEELLALLEQNKRTFLSTREMSERLRVHPYVVYQAIKELRRWDFEISSEKGKGYKLLRAPDLLLPGEIKRKLRTKVFGKEVLSYRTLGSTNQLAFRLAEGGAPEGTLIVADEQTKGRGRMGRSWYSPPRVGLWMSIILRPDIPPFKAPGLSIGAGLALAQAIGHLTGIEAKIKWPNDCLLNGRK